jgi:hypothetical protein
VGARKSLAQAQREGFYSDALSEAEQLLLEIAREMEGLDEEIAVLRVRLRKALDERPEDLRLLTHGVDMLVKAVAAQYRLSPKARRDLSDHLSNLLNSLGDQLLPAANVT